MDYTLGSDGKKAAAAMLIGGLFAMPPVVASASTQSLSSQANTNTVNARPSKKKSRFSGYVSPAGGLQVKSGASIDSTLLKFIPVVSSIGSTGDNGVSSFYERVENILKLFGLNKSQLAAVLNVQRKSIYDWRAKPEIDVRDITVKRIQALEELLEYMDDGHSQMTAKLSFGSLGRKDLAQALTGRELDIVELKKLYDFYWLEFDGMYKRSILTKATKGFEKSPLDGRSFVGA